MRNFGGEEQDIGGAGDREGIRAERLLERA